MMVGAYSAISACDREFPEIVAEGCVIEFLLPVQFDIEINEAGVNRKMFLEIGAERQRAERYIRYDGSESLTFFVLDLLDVLRRS